VVVKEKLLKFTSSRIKLSLDVRRAVPKPYSVESSFNKYLLFYY
jgi:hypothetical protein